MERHRGGASGRGRRYRGSVVTLVAVVVLLVCGVGRVAGLPAGSADDAVAVSGWAAVGTLLAGTVVLLVSVEVLIQALVRTAREFQVSAFLLAVVFSGFEFDNLAFGVFNGFRELQEVSFGLAVGNSLSIFGLVLALGALLYPFEVDVPRAYLLLLVAAPFVLLPSVLLGQFTAGAGLVLVALGVVVFGYLYRRERAADRPVAQDHEMREALVRADGEVPSVPAPLAPIEPLARRSWFWPAVMVVAVGGIVVGAEGSSAGVEGVLQTWELTGTFLGATLVTLLYTADDLLLAVEPLRLGHVDVAVGGIVGSLLFFVTANVGVVALVGTVEVSRSTALLHLPALVAITALSAYFLGRGRMGRRQGLVLLGFYVAYLALNLVLFSGLPIGE